MRFGIWSLDLAIRDFAFSSSNTVKSSVRTGYKKSILLIFVIRENELFISVIRNLLFFRLGIVPDTPPFTTLFSCLLLAIA